MSKLINENDFGAVTANSGIAEKTTYTDGDTILIGDSADSGALKRLASSVIVGQLEKITENSQTGWRLRGRDPDNYGDIGDGAIDFSYSSSASPTRGATGQYSFAEGNFTTASALGSHAEGNGNLASGLGSHAEGYGTVAFGDYSHAEGFNATASGNYSHAGGISTTASGHNSHAEGFHTIASGSYSHAEGNYTTAAGQNSHAEGFHTTAGHNDQHVSGQYNDNQNGTAVEVGWGTSSVSANIYELYQDGTISLPLCTTVLINSRGSTALTTKEYVDAKQAQLERITEGSNTGWRILGRNPDNYGDIGDGAIDFSYSSSASPTRGATGNYSFAEGRDTTASGYYSHAEGRRANASGDYSHAEGSNTQATGFYSHTEGGYATASGSYSHAEGEHTTASGSSSHAEGANTTAGHNYQHASGKYNDNKSDTVVEVGWGTSSSNELNIYELYTDGTISLPLCTTALIDGRGSTALTTKEYVDAKQAQLEKITEGSNTGWRILGRDPDNYGDIGSGAIDFSYSDISSTTKGATGQYSFAEGRSTTSSGHRSHAEGMLTISSNYSSHAEGESTTASGASSHAEGNYTTASGTRSHAEGFATTASGTSSHAEGDNTSASGDYSHAEGRGTSASGSYSHAEGQGTVATHPHQHASGKFNDNKTGTVVEVGWGTSSSNKLNIYELYTDGTATLPEATISEIDSRGDKAIVTKEYVSRTIRKDGARTAEGAGTFDTVITGIAIEGKSSSTNTVSPGWKVIGVDAPASKKWSASLGSAGSLMTIAGSNDGQNGTTAVFTFLGNAWKTETSYIIDIAGLSGIGVRNNAMCVGGDKLKTGVWQDTYTSHFAFFIPNSWATVSLGGPLKRFMAFAGTPNSAVIMGGTDGSPGGTGSTVSDWNGHTWTSSFSLPPSSCSHANAAGVSNSLVISGGYDDSPSAYLNSTYFRIGRGIFVTAGTLNTARSFHAHVGMKFSSLVSGGFTGSSSLSSTEENDGYSWHTTQSLNVARITTNSGGLASSAIVGLGNITGTNIDKVETKHTISRFEVQGYSIDDDDIQYTNDNLILSDSSAFQFSLMPVAPETSSDESHFVKELKMNRFDSYYLSVGPTLPSAIRAQSSAGTKQNTLLAGGYITTSVTSVQKVQNGTISASTSLLVAKSITNGVGHLGSALVAAGQSGSDYTSATDTAVKFSGSVWSSTGSLSTKRCYGGMTGAMNSALVFGGVDESGNLQVDEFFNGTSWSSLSSKIDSSQATGSAGTGSRFATVAIVGYSSGHSTRSSDFNGNSWISGSDTNVKHTEGKLLGSSAFPSVILGLYGYVEMKIGKTWRLMLDYGSERRYITGNGSSTQSFISGGNDGTNNKNTSYYLEDTIVKRTDEKSILAFARY